MIFRRKGPKHYKKAVMEALAGIRIARAKVRFYSSRLRPLAQRDENARRLLETIYYIDFILEAISLRLETILAVPTSMEGLERLLRLPYQLSKEIARQASILPPDLGSIMSSIEQSISALVPDPVSLEVETSPNPQVETILDEARRKARSSVEEELEAGKA